MTVLPHAIKKTSSSAARGEITYRPDKKVCAQPKPNTKTIARLVPPVRPNTRRKASPSPSAKERKKKRSQQHPAKSNSTLSEGPERKVRKIHPPTLPPTRHCVLLECQPDLTATCRIARACQKGNGLPFRNSTSGQFRRLESTGRVVHLRLVAFTVHTRRGGGGGGGAGDEGIGVNHRISRSRSGRRRRAGGLSLRVSVFSLLGSRSSQFCNDSLVVNNNAIGSPAGF
jgi:hypothetical protein